MARRKGVLLASVVALGLAACGGEPEEQAADVARLVRSVVVGGSNAAGTRQFPGKVEAYRQADIGFRIDGKVTTIEVKEGEQVAENQLLARLDQTDLRITLKDRQATYDANNANYLRGKELVAEGAISRMDFDKLEAAFKTADAALEQARQNIAYTELRAPFAGNISRRLVERFEEVQAKQPVFELRDVSRLEVKFDVPENLVIGMRSARKDDAPIPVYAVFESLPQVQFPLQIKEVATSADPKTQTFEVTMSMPRPEQLNLLPGMTTMVTVDFASQCRTRG